MKSKTSFKHESLLDPKTVQELLKNIGKSLSRNDLKFVDSDGSTLQLEPSQLLYTKVTAAVEDNQQTIDIRIRWDKLPQQLHSKPPIIED